MRKKSMIFWVALLGVFLFNSSSASAKVTVYDFGASWCGPCHEDIKRDYALEKKFGEQNVDFKFVVEDKEPEAADQFIKNSPPIDIIRDPSHELAKQKGATGKTPYLVIEGSKGTKHLGGTVNRRDN